MAVAASGDALDWALALVKAPNERLSLRRRPLPQGIEPLLQIAAGNAGDALANAVRRTGESEEELVEASRFYLREVLFHSGADAYRVLGLDRTAAQSRIKTHHRWLQQWLHPDRQTSDWDAIFAGRVNAAWNQVRNEERRRAYDAAHPAPDWNAELEASGPVGGGWIHQPVVQQTSRERWQRRVPLLMLVFACVGLGVLALRDAARDELLVAAPLSDGNESKATDGTDGAMDVFGGMHLPATAPPKRTARTPPKPRATAIEKRAGQAPNVTVATRDLPRNEAARPEPVKKVPVMAAVAASVRATPEPPKAPPVPRRQAAPVPAPGAPTSVAAVPAGPTVAAASPAAPRAPSPVSSDRIRKAQEVGDRLLVFMRRRSASVPPIWDSVPVQRGAAQLREELLANGDAGFSQPDWRVGQRDAKMVVDVRHADGRRGRLAGSLVWREERWLVTQLSMERDW